jgi:hypothetical protein
VLQQSPASRLTRLIDWHRPHRRPQLNERAQHSGFGQLPPQQLAQLDRSRLPFLIQDLPGPNHQRRGSAAGRGAPLAIPPNGRHPGQNLRRDQEISLLGIGSQQVERDDAAFIHQARGKFAGVDEGGRRGRRTRGPTNSLDERRRWCGKLRMARQEQTQPQVVQPGSGFIGGHERSGLMPERGARGL